MLLSLMIVMTVISLSAAQHPSSNLLLPRRALPGWPEAWQGLTGRLGAEDGNPNEANRHGRKKKPASALQRIAASVQAQKVRKSLLSKMEHSSCPVHKEPFH